MLNKNVLIIGYGESGKSAKQLLDNFGYLTTVFDDKVSLVSDYLTFIPNQSLLVVSPSVSNEHKLLIEARRSAIPIISEIELAYRFYIEFSKINNIVAVTGTNGKTTIVSMLGNILLKNSIVAGNIGTPWSSSALNKKINILELSSYQLENIKSFVPHIAIITNLKPDHIERHKTFEEYVRCKSRIFENQNINDYLLLNCEDTLLLNINCKSQKIYFGRNNIFDGTYIFENSIYYRSFGYEEKVIDLKDLTIIGEHNVSNILAVVLACKILNVNNHDILLGLQNYKYEPFRLQKLNNTFGFNIFNDSKSTNVAATISAIDAVGQNIIVILGGQDKLESLSPLFENNISCKIKHYIFFGQSKFKFKNEAISHNLINYSVCENLHEVVSRAVCLCNKTDVILFSPACASFDMFKSYKDRGEKFNTIITNILGQQS